MHLDVVFSTGTPCFPPDTVFSTRPRVFHTPGPRTPYPRTPAPRFPPSPLHVISTWFAWLSHRISRNCFFFSNIFSNFRNRPWFSGVSVYIQVSTLDTQSKALEVVRTEISKSPTRSRAFSFSTGLLCKETPVLRSAILLQPCTTSFPRHF